MMPNIFNSGVVEGLVMKDSCRCFIFEKNVLSCFIFKMFSENIITKN